MVQTITSPDLVVNVVRFAMFGFISGKVTLNGKLQELDEKLVRVDFESLSLQIGPFKFNYGRASNLRISVIHLTVNVRLGRGSRGSVFFFSRRQEWRKETVGHKSWVKVAQQSGFQNRVGLKTEFDSQQSGTRDRLGLTKTERYCSREIAFRLAHSGGLGRPISTC